MGQDTSISWTDNTFNPWIGCTKVSPGCDNCYAESLDHRWGKDRWGKGKPRTTTSDSNWLQPLKWNREAERLGEVSKVFCGSLCDVMDDEAPDGQRERLWTLINDTPNLFWQLLSKRPQRYFRYLPEGGFKHGNVILGTTAETQDFYDIRMVPLEHAAAIHKTKMFVSYEPALGPLTLRNSLVKPNWLIFGGETGPHPRPMEQVWAENVKRECEELGIAFFMKQMSARTPGKAAELIPAHLLVREFPV